MVEKNFGLVRISKNLAFGTPYDTVFINQSMYLKEVCEAECDPVGYHIDKEGGGHHYPTPATVWGLQGVRRGGRSD